MPRTKPPERIEEIARAAVARFTEVGFKRTQMADVAGVAGVAAGSLYLYVGGKEALLHLAVLRVCDCPLETLDLPLAAPGMAASAGVFTAYSGEVLHWPTLDAALEPGADVDGDMLRAIGRELYDMLHRARRAIWLLDSCAPDIPEFETLRSRDLRARYRDRLAVAAMKALGSDEAPSPGTRLAARVAIEAVAWGAMHRLRESPANAIDRLEEAQARELVADSFAACLMTAGES